MIELELKGLRFKSPIGCFPEEKIIHPLIEVDLFIFYDGQTAMLTDNLDHALDYQAIYFEVKKILSSPANLLEHAAYRIGNHLMQKFSSIVEIKVNIKKIKPALGGEIESVGVKYTFSRTTNL